MGSSSGGSTTPRSTTTANTSVAITAAIASTSLHSNIGTSVFKIMQALMQEDHALGEDEIMRLTAIYIPSNPELVQQLRRNPRIEYNSDDNTYKYKPIHNIRSKDDIVNLVNTSAGKSGMDVRELQESWKDALKSIDELDSDGRIIVLRTRDNKARFVYPAENIFEIKISGEFKKMWHEIHVPKESELNRELEKAGLKAATSNAKPEKPVVLKYTKIKKKIHKRIKITNKHLVGLDLTQDIN